MMAAESKFRHTRNPFTMFGAWLTTVSALLFLAVFFADLVGLPTNPYIGIVFFLVLPGFFVFGLVLIPFGIVLSRRRERLGRPAASITWPVIDLNTRHTRTVAALLIFLTFANIVVISLAAFRGVEYMDSPQFCGQVCHTVMQPEFTAYQAGPHARVHCVACHIGPGAPWFVKAKLSGTRQLFAVAFKTYPEPIPSPVENLRPARDTCEQCHWPEKFTGDRVKQVREFAEDEANTESTTTLRLHVGSGSDSIGAHGIHWHMAPSTRVSYISTDDKRQTIVYVEVEDRNGIRKFRAEGVTDEQLKKGEHRQMDCMDCHNRPSHRFDSTPERAVNDAISNGLIAPSLPFARREAVAALKTVYTSQEAASAGIAKRLSSFFDQQLGQQAATRKADISRAIGATQDIYRRNIFPSMKVSWGTYPNNIGHIDFPGCFRCHDDAKKTGDGRVIKQDCELCHKIE
jgi:nitrate/TMAO reductase-like tetraheme cytochrome c subunit